MTWWNYCASTAATNELRRGGNRSTRCIVYTKARDLLGWTPRVTFANGIAKTIAYYQKQVA